MFLVGFFSWWYGRGWVGQWRRIAERFRRTLDFFSVGQLLATLFSPFRQISASGVSQAGVGAALRAFFDKLISRVIGAIVRLGTIFVGMFVIFLQAVYEVIIMAVWWFLPLLPVAGLVLFAVGWVPSWT